jgi:1,2-diacylglycerol 3-alpha-glucosyltransferase
MKRIVNSITDGRGRTFAQPFRAAGSHIGILNDYVKIPYANGSSFASQLLYRHLRRLGSTVTIIGARDPNTTKAELPDTYASLPSLPLRSHPGVYIAMPDRSTLQRLASLKIDLTLGQTASQLLQAGLWLRLRNRTPLLCVNTIHLPSVYEAILPESLPETSFLHRSFRQRVVPWLTRETVRLYNQSDGLIVLSSGLKRYWEDLGVSVPVTVIPRAIEPDIFDLPALHDPIPSEFPRDHRLLCVCRHTREKSLDRLLRIFAKFIAPVNSRATLTLVGDGPDHASLKALAIRLGIGNRVHFAGERPLTEIPNYYRAADVFVYTSLSETYGQVISEAVWPSCRCPGRR